MSPAVAAGCGSEVIISRQSRFRGRWFGTSLLRPGVRAVGVLKRASRRVSRPPPLPRGLYPPHTYVHWAPHRHGIPRDASDFAPVSLVISSTTASIAGWPNRARDWSTAVRPVAAGRARFGLHVPHLCCCSCSPSTSSLTLRTPFHASTRHAAVASGLDSSRTPGPRWRTAALGWLISFPAASTDVHPSVRQTCQPSRTSAPTTPAYGRNRLVTSVRNSEPPAPLVRPRRSGRDDDLSRARPYIDGCPGRGGRCRGFGPRQAWLRDLELRRLGGRRPGPFSLALGLCSACRTRSCAGEKAWPFDPTTSRRLGRASLREGRSWGGGKERRTGRGVNTRSWLVSSSTYGGGIYGPLVKRQLETRMSAWTG